MDAGEGAAPFTNVLNHGALHVYNAISECIKTAFAWERRAAFHRGFG